MSLSIKGTIKSSYPCCKGACLLPFYAAIKREKYERRCPRCGKLWAIERRLLSLLGKDGSRIDQLDWQEES